MVLFISFVFDIYLFYKPQIANLIIKKAFTNICSKY